MPQTEAAALIPIPLPRTVSPEQSAVQQIAGIRQQYNQALTYKGMEVNTDIQYVEAGTAWAYCKATVEAIETLMGALRKPYRDEAQSIIDTEKNLTGPIKTVLAELKSKMDAFDKAKQEAARELALANAAPWEDVNEASIMVTTPKVAGVTTKQGPVKIRITNMAAVIEWAISGHRDMLTIDEKMLKAYATKHADLVAIPGVEVYRDTVMARTGGGR